jgi:hypothetical protein
LGMIKIGPWPNEMWGVPELWKPWGRRSWWPEGAREIPGGLSARSVQATR